MACRKLIQTTLLGLTLFLCVLLGLGQSSALAATFIDTRLISQSQIPAISEAAPTLESVVDRFLTSIPFGYFTIANVAGLKTQLKNPQTMLVDVREPSEYQSGHIPDAINIPLRMLAQKLGEIPRDRPVVMYCSTGYRSAMGVMTLHLLGYDNVQGFPPSFAAWKTAGEAIAK
jgi:rhodanese-related sulfurtransferase